MVSKRELYKRIKEPEKVEKGRKGRLITQRTIDMEHDILPGEEGKVRGLVMIGMRMYS